MFNQIVYNFPSLLANKFSRSKVDRITWTSFLDGQLFSTVNALMQTEFGSFRMAHEILIRFYWVCKVKIWSDLLLSLNILCSGPIQNGLKFHCYKCESIIQSWQIFAFHSAQFVVATKFIMISFAKMFQWANQSNRKAPKRDPFNWMF